MAKKTFKGKYPGPDSLKGDKAKRAAYRKALKSGKSKKKALTSAKGTKAASKAPATPAAPKVDTTPSAPNIISTVPSSPVASNSSGTIQLQTNADIEDAVLQAEEAQRIAETEATQLEQQAIIDRLTNNETHRQASNSERGKVNAANAYRGLRGRSAQHRRDLTEADITERKNLIDQNFNQANETARNRRLAGSEGLRHARATATQRRLEFTNAQSRNNPTVGSTPVDAGVKPTSPAGTSGKPAPKPTTSAPKPTASKSTFKGNYPGPDKLKGNKAKLAAYRKALKSGKSKKKSLKTAMR